MGRRDFLKKSSAAAASTWVAGASPAFVGSSNKTGSGETIIGTGAHTYMCEHHWGQLPEHLRWEITHGVTIDRAGMVYIKQQGHKDGKKPLDTIVVFDPDGKFVRSFGKEYYPGGHGIDIRVDGGEEFLYLCDVHNRQVLKTSLTGELVWKKSHPTEPGVYGEDKAFVPTNVAFAPDGGLYVADGYGSHYIHQYDSEGTWVRTWGGAGTEAGKMQTPHGIWFDDRPGRDPSLVVADRANARLQYFTLEGEHSGFVDDVLFPAHFDIRGDVLLVSDLHARVTLLDRDNMTIVHLGEDPVWREEVKKFEIRKTPEICPEGKFIHPHDACFDAAGNIFVVEWVHTGRVSLLRRVV
jgi:hypothetical protein